MGNSSSSKTESDTEPEPVEPAILTDADLQIVPVSCTGFEEFEQQMVISSPPISPLENIENNPDLNGRLVSIPTHKYDDDVVSYIMNHDAFRTVSYCTIAPVVDSADTIVVMVSESNYGLIHTFWVIRIIPDQQSPQHMQMQVIHRWNIEFRAHKKKVSQPKLANMELSNDATQLYCAWSNGDVRLYHLKIGAECDTVTDSESPTITPLHDIESLRLDPYASIQIASLEWDSRIVPSCICFCPALQMTIVPFIGGFLPSPVAILDAQGNQVQTNFTHADGTQVDSLPQAMCVSSSPCLGRQQHRHSGKHIIAIASRLHVHDYRIQMYSLHVNGDVEQMYDFVGIEKPLNHSKWRYVRTLFAFSKNATHMAVYQQPADPESDVPSLALVIQVSDGSIVQRASIPQLAQLAQHKDVTSLYFVAGSKRLVMQRGLLQSTILDVTNGRFAHRCHQHHLLESDVKTESDDDTQLTKVVTNLNRNWTVVAQAPSTLKLWPCVFHSDIPNAQELFVALFAKPVTVTVTVSDSATGPGTATTAHTLSHTSCALESIRKHPLLDPNAIAHIFTYLF
jgi:hypothetical protein